MDEVSDSGRFCPVILWLWLECLGLSMSDLPSSLLPFLLGAIALSILPVPCWCFLSFTGGCPSELIILLVAAGCIPLGALVAVVRSDGGIRWAILVIMEAIPKIRILALICMFGCRFVCVLHCVKDIIKLIISVTAAEVGVLRSAHNNSTTSSFCVFGFFRWRSLKLSRNMVGVALTTLLSTAGGRGTNLQ